MADTTTCTSCGNDLAEGVRFCTTCGTANPAADAPAADATVAETPPIAATQQFPAPGPAQPQPAWGAPPPQQAWEPPAAQGKTKGSWPLAPLTVPIALVIGTVLYGLVANAVLANIGFVERLDLVGTGAASAVFAVLLLLPLLLLSLLRRGPGRAGAALLGGLGTVVAFAAIAVLVGQVVVQNSFGQDQAVGTGELFSNLPQSLFIPYDILIASFFDVDLLVITTDDGLVSAVVILTWALLMAVLGFGGGLAATGRAGYAALAGLGGLVGGLLGETVLELLLLVSRDTFYSFEGPSPLILIPVVVAGLGIGCGAAIGGALSKPAAA